jgi:hypothetical protein
MSEESEDNYYSIEIKYEARHVVGVHAPDLETAERIALDGMYERSITYVREHEQVREVQWQCACCSNRHSIGPGKLCKQCIADGKKYGWD